MKIKLKPIVKFIMPFVQFFLDNELITLESYVTREMRIVVSAEYLLRYGNLPKEGLIFFKSYPFHQQKFFCNDEPEAVIYFLEQLFTNGFTLYDQSPWLYTFDDGNPESPSGTIEKNRITGQVQELFAKAAKSPLRRLDGVISLLREPEVYKLRYNSQFARLMTPISENYADIYTNSKAKNIAKILCDLLDYAAPSSERAVVSLMTGVNWCSNPLHAELFNRMIHHESTLRIVMSYSSNGITNGIRNLLRLYENVTVYQKADDNQRREFSSPDSDTFGALLTDPHKPGMVAEVLENIIVDYLDRYICPENPCLRMIDVLQFEPQCYGRILFNKYYKELVETYIFSTNRRWKNLHAVWNHLECVNNQEQILWFINKFYAYPERQFWLKNLLELRPDSLPAKLRLILEEHKERLQADYIEKYLKIWNPESF